MVLELWGIEVTRSTSEREVNLTKILLSFMLELLTIRDANRENLRLSCKYGDGKGVET